jgi:hypothetical protein
VFNTNTLKRLPMRRGESSWGGKLGLENQSFVYKRR